MGNPNALVILVATWHHAARSSSAAVEGACWRAGAAGGRAAAHRKPLPLLQSHSASPGAWSAERLTAAKKLLLAWGLLAVAVFGLRVASLTARPSAGSYGLRPCLGFRNTR